MARAGGGSVKLGHRRATIAPIAFVTSREQTTISIVPPFSCGLRMATRAMPRSSPTADSTACFVSGVIVRRPACLRRAASFLRSLKAQRLENGVAVFVRKIADGIPNAPDDETRAP
jgi:hypothetical protein